MDVRVEGIRRQDHALHECEVAIEDIATEQRMDALVRPSNFCSVSVKMRLVLDVLCVIDCGLR